MIRDLRKQRIVLLSFAVLFGLSVINNTFAADEAEEPPTIEVESSNPLHGNEDAIKAGGTLYFKWCAACHGPKADGVARFGKYAYDLRKYWRGYGEYVGLVLNGRPKKQMPPWKEVLNVEEISQIGAFLETKAIEGAYWK